MSNVVTFPGRNPARLGNPSFRYQPAPLPAENVRSVEIRVERGRRRSAASMHTYVFRSYDLILASDEAELVRDVRCDAAKAASKLKSIREQIQRDREHAAAREDLLTKAEARLAAALAVVSSTCAEG
ncbi:hypothetical protein I6F30_25490 [Bradyrhizobium sp. NBAIM20]|uniref:hypothetical protein n=1 Tax=unclassified Bradyrhizobium TaxID=2631580 RepID=UPI001CD4FF29|nr:MULTISPECIES: hypothetical protein [unclassified Bradyrhizobium]MCA1414480.1 hypothetical protein [Bradyrhizobium sp. NBAIM20]MCA1459858.1 hypothetical protein [Bradyrhizobium sp. NBAIM18]